MTEEMKGLAGIAMGVPLRGVRETGENRRGGL